MAKNISKSFHKSKERFKDVELLARRLELESPSPGDYLFDYKLADMEASLKEMDAFEAKKKYKVFFSDLPISKALIHGLSRRNFTKMTEIQRCVIPHALCGRDLMAASRTGSGKTLSYLVPVIERLYLKKWTVLDGLGALVILPTRELAIQVFQVFNSITEYNELSVGLIIGGKDLEYEKKNIHIMNVLICTPGRLLQHMEESPGFNADNLQMLVLDEADMILEMGFSNTLRAIMRNLPQEKQTMLFSATLSKNIQELGRLSLKAPEFIFLHVARQKEKEQENTETQQQTLISELYEIPNKLEQYYMKIPIQDKLDNLFSFLKAHLKSKVLIFFSTCKQVRFAFESFKKLRLGIPVLELHGRQKQSKRMAIFFTFSEKRSVALMTTNIAARGLDFPFVDWIVQVDIPENAVTYIHRIGRTARYNSSGKTLMFLSPEESLFLDRLKEKRIEIKKIEPNPKKALTIKSSLQSFVSESIDLKYLAQRAFISYMRFVYLATDKEVFNVHRINAAEYAESLGLIQAPVIKFKQTEEGDLGENEPKKSKLQRLKEKIKQKKIEKQAGKQGEIGKKEEENVDFDEKLWKKEEKKAKNQETMPEKQDKMTKNQEKVLKKRKRENTDVLSARFENLREKTVEQTDEEEDDLLVFKKGPQTHEVEQKEVGLGVSKRQLKKIKPEGHFEGRNKLKFDEEGQKYTLDEMKMKEYKQNLEEVKREQKDFMQDYKRKVLVNKEKDEERELNRRKEKRKKRKAQKSNFEAQSREVFAGELAEEEDLSGNEEEDQDL